MTETQPEQRLKRLAADLGFDVCRIADARAQWAAGPNLAAFIAAGRHGEMAWMAATAARRAHPTAMWPNAASAVVVGLNYGPASDPLDALARADRGAISVYAQGSDYHDLIKKRLKRLARDFADAVKAEVKVFVDTAPLMEKPLAARAGLGWQGKHTNLVNRELGSWLFLGVMLTDAVLQPDKAEIDHCGSCRACLDACPTDAFPKPYELDARRCISYLTIEHKGPIPGEFREAIGNRIYGCDDCLAVCPWNKFAQTAREIGLHARAELKAPRLADLAVLDEDAFRDVFAGSPIKRIGRERFVRNVLTAIGNSKRPELAERCLKLLGDPSSLVRGAAIWALRRLDAARFEVERTRRAGSETDADVRREWEAGDGAIELAFHT